MLSSWFAESSATANNKSESQAAVLEDWPSIRILVVGDSGVGKTCLVERLVTNKIPSTPRWTLGCNVQVMAHTMLDQSSDRKLVVEFWDIGGHRNFADSRAVFYHQINGILLVHDYTNKKSFAHLSGWVKELEMEDKLKRERHSFGIEEVRFGRHHRAGGFTHNATVAASPRFKLASLPLHSLTQRHHSTTSQNNSSSHNHHHHVLDGLPMLVVGNKCDGTVRPLAPPPKLFNYESIYTSATTPGDRLMEQDRFTQFFQLVYERKYCL